MPASTMLWPLNCSYSSRVGPKKLIGAKAHSTLSGTIYCRSIGGIWLDPWNPKWECRLRKGAVVINHSPAWLKRKPIIGVLHVPALPGTPCNSLNLNEIRDWVTRDAEAYWAGGVTPLCVDALL